MPEATSFFNMLIKKEFARSALKFPRIEFYFVGDCIIYDVQVCLPKY